MLPPRWIGRVGRTPLHAAAATTEVVASYAARGRLYRKLLWPRPKSRTQGRRGPATDQPPCHLARSCTAPRLVSYRCACVRGVCPMPHVSACYGGPPLRHVACRTPPPALIAPRAPLARRLLHVPMLQRPSCTSIDAWRCALSTGANFGARWRSPSIVRCATEARKIAAETHGERAKEKRAARHLFSAPILPRFCHFSDVLPRFHPVLPQFGRFHMPFGRGLPLFVRRGKGVGSMKRLGGKRHASASCRGSAGVQPMSSRASAADRTLARTGRTGQRGARLSDCAPLLQLMARGRCRLTRHMHAG